MFYQKKAIDQHLTCKICNNLFVNPRVLPCSHAYCHSCILSQTSQKDNTIVCIKCETRHKVPESGFLISRTIVDLLEEQARAVSQSNQVKDLREKLDSIDSKCKELAESLRTGDEEIEEHCRSLRQKIDLVTETRIEEIRLMNENFKKQVDEYEKECSSSFDLISKSQEFPSLFIQMSSFGSATLDILSQFQVKPQEVDICIQDSIKHLSLIKSKKDLVERKKFSDKRMHFEPELSKLNSTYLGVITQNNLIPISARSLNVKAPSNNLLQAAYSASDQLIYAVYQIGVNIALAFYDKNGYSVGNRIPIRLFYGSYRLNQDESEMNTGCTLLSILISKDYCVLALKKTFVINEPNTRVCSRRTMIIRIHPPLAAHNYQLQLELNNSRYTFPLATVTFLIKMNKEQAYVNHFGINHDFNFQAVNSSNIYFMDQVNKRIWVYTTDLCDTGSHFTENIPVETTRAMQANDQSLFILHQDSDQMKLRVISIESKTIKLNIELPSLHFNQLKIVSSNYLVAFDNKNNQFWFLDQKSWTELNGFLKQNEIALMPNLYLARDDSLFFIFFNSSGLRSLFSLEEY